jgi:hypothetical protein
MRVGDGGVGSGELSEAYEGEGPGEINHTAPWESPGINGG